MREFYDIIIKKLERDKLRFSEDIKYYIDDAEYNEISKIGYNRAKAKKDYCMDLIEFFKEARDNS